MLLAAVLVGAALVSGAAAQPVSSQADPDGPAIDRALAQLRQDPSLSGKQKVWTLRWNDSERKTPSNDTGWWRWLARFFSWFGQSTRWLVWIAVVVLAAMLVVYLGRAWQRYDRRPDEQALAIPTHVRDLDIRPESLPDDIGAAARVLWDSGQERSALALLYRGLLSRLTHVHGVPVRESTTEGECMALAERLAPASVSAYADRLVVVWQRLVYGGIATGADTAHALCADFAAALKRGHALPSPVEETK